MFNVTRTFSSFGFELFDDNGEVLKSETIIKIDNFASFELVGGFIIK